MFIREFTYNFKNKTSYMELIYILEECQYISNENVYKLIYLENFYLIQCQISRGIWLLII